MSRHALPEADRRCGLFQRVLIRLGIVEDPLRDDPAVLSQFLSQALYVLLQINTFVVIQFSIRGLENGLKYLDVFVQLLKRLRSNLLHRPLAIYPTDRRSGRTVTQDSPT
jgi:hypothetical protein